MRLRAFLSTAFLLASALPADAQRRWNMPPGSSNWVPQAPSLLGGLVTSDMQTGGQTPASLVQALVGPGAIVSNIQFTGSNIAAGTFSGGTGIIGFEQGVILSSGNIASVAGPMNDQANTTTDLLQPGDPDLDALTTSATDDATILEFDFECSSTNVISFQYVFTSEEYDEYVNSGFNDVFAFFLNGQNIALIPSTTTPVTINNVNCNNPYNPPTGSNCALYTTNDCDSLGSGFPCSNIATEMDGMTHLFSATGTLLPGVNHIKLAIADAGDEAWDSNVFLRGESFVCSQPAPVFEPPSPCGQTLTAYVGQQLSFSVVGLATNGQANQSATLSVTGDPAPLAGGTFTPPLPAGPAQPVSSQYQWTPTAADVGTYDLTFTVTDQLGQTATCDVTIVVGFPPPTPFCFGDGTAANCPCNNNGAPGNGCANSTHPGGANLAALGNPSLANDTIVFVVTDQHPSYLTLFWQGTTEINPVFGGDGLRCLAGLQRMFRVKAALSSTLAAPDGDSIPPSPATVSGVSALHGDPLLPGSVRGYMAYYRDANPTFCPIPQGNTFNITNAIRITWGP